MAHDQGSHQGHQCSKTALTDNPCSKVWVAPLGRKLLPPLLGSKKLVHWTSETWLWKENAGGSTGPSPPVTGMGLMGS
jgi:hypothetical protein